MVDCGVYGDGTRLPGKYTHAAALNKVREIEAEGRNAFVWIGLHEPDEHQMQAVADVFCLHPLAVEDAVHAHQRPKLERYDTRCSWSSRPSTTSSTNRWPMAREIVETGEIMIFVGPDFVVTVRHGEHGGLAGVRKHLEASPANLKLGPYSVMHAIADHVVDTYLDVTDLIENDIDAMEEDIFSPLAQTNIESIYLLKREVVELRRAISPLATDLQRIGTDHNDLINVEIRRYMRDVLDHTIKAADRDRQLRRAAELAGAGRGRQGRDAAEHRHAQDLRMGGDRGGAHRAGRRLRNELRLHAGAALEVRISHGSAVDSDGLHPAVPDVPAQQLALTIRSDWRPAARSDWRPAAVGSWYRPCPDPTPPSSRRHP